MHKKLPAASFYLFCLVFRGLLSKISFVDSPPPPTSYIRTYEYVLRIFADQVWFHIIMYCALTRGGMHSQASYWFSIGFKQMVCTVATCYWFLALLWFNKTRSFLFLEHYNRVPHCPKFFPFILTIIFSQYSGTY
jgi:hypothetical protein